MTNETPNSNKSSLIAYQVRETDNSKSFWNRIGAAWNNKDGGFTIQLECLPIDGRIVCCPQKADSN